MTSQGAAPKTVHQPFFGGDRAHYYELATRSHSNHPPQSGTVEEQSLSFWIAGLDNPDPSKTLRRNIRRLLPGETLDVDRWVVKADHAKPEFEKWLDKPQARLTELVRTRLFAAVHRATSDARMVAVLLGGFDSSAVLAVLTQIRPRDTICAVTVDFPGSNPDRAFAAELCRQLGVVHSVVERTDWVPVHKFVVLDGIPAASLYGGGELAAYVRAASLGADRVVTAILGDAFFGGCLGQIGAEFFWRSPLAAVRLALAAELPDDDSIATRLRRLVVGPNVRNLPPALRRYRTKRQWRKAMPWATKRFHALLAPARAGAWERYKIPTSPGEAFTTWASSAELGTMVEICSAFAGAAGVTWREALADFALADLLCAIPIERLFSGGRFRGLLREALADIIPEPVLSRRTKAEFAATPVILNSMDQVTVKSLTGVDMLHERGLMRGPAVRRAFDESANHFWIWRALAAEALLRAVS